MAKKKRNSVPKFKQDELREASNLLASIETLRREDQLLKARKVCSELVRRYPEYVSARRTLGLILIDLEKFEEALTHLCIADYRSPDDHRTLIALGRAKVNSGMVDSAIADLKKAIDLEPSSIPARMTLLEIFGAHGMDESLIEYVEDVLRTGTRDAETLLRLAVALVEVGQVDRVRQICQGFLARKEYSDALLQILSQLPKNALDVDLVELADKVAAAAGKGKSDHFSVLGVGYHHRGEWAKAWQNFQNMHEVHKESALKNWQEGRNRRALVLEQIRSAPAFTTPTELSASETGTLFILGESRSGKSSLEGLLGELPSIKKGYESNLPSRVFNRVLDRAGCISLDELAEMPAELGSDYRTAYGAAVAQATNDHKYITNTAPNIASRALWIRQYVPGAKFVAVQRNNVDQIFRIYSYHYKHLVDGLPYAANLQSISERLDWYADVISGIAEKLPEDMIVVQYEDMVANPEATVRSVMKLCGIEEPLKTPMVVGDDRGAGAPYAQWIEQELS